MAFRVLASEVKRLRSGGNNWYKIFNLVDKAAATSACRCWGCGTCISCRVCVCAAVLGVVIVSKNIRGSSVTVISVTYSPEQLYKKNIISHISQLYIYIFP
jgi:hypothetical protein